MNNFSKIENKLMKAFYATKYFWTVLKVFQTHCKAFHCLRPFQKGWVSNWVRPDVFSNPVLNILQIYLFSRKASFCWCTDKKSKSKNKKCKK